MLRGLRAKFVALNMVTVVLVLTVAFSAVCILFWQQAVEGVYDAMRVSIAKAADGASSEVTSSAPRPLESVPHFSIGSVYDEEDRELVPVAVYACVGESLESVPFATTATLSEEAVARATEEVLSAPAGRGDVADCGLFYLKRTVGPTTYVAFADHASAGSWQSLIPVLAVVGIAAMLVFLVLAIAFARWALRPVESAWESQRQFVADASHELKTPLAVILANSAILMERPGESVASQSKWVESTRREAESMQALVEGMLELARVDAKATAVRERVDLSDIVELELLQFESVAYERGIDLRSEVEQGVLVMGDRARLERTVATLLENACKYADEGGLVGVCLRSRGRKAELSVANTGVPIAPEDLPYVFDRFYRADKARTRGVGGFGLGLAIAREAVEGMGGSIRAHSDASTTTFTVEMPLA